MNRPNILLIHCHDLGNWLGCYGNPTLQTPNLDRLANQGVLFQNVFCTAPQCSPSRSSLYTGRYPHCNGVMGLTHAEFAWDLYPDEKHLAQYLKEAGYRTAGVGNIHETDSGPARIGLDRHQDQRLAAKMAETALGFLGDLAVDQTTPFYLQVGFIEPHRLNINDQPSDYMGFLTPEFGPDTTLGVTVPKYLVDNEGSRAEVAELQGSIRHVDEHIGLILNKLDELGLSENTLTLFTSDHGVALPRAKCSLYDPGLRISLIARYPQNPAWCGGKACTEIISNLDVLPSLLELLEIPVPGEVQGLSFTPLLEGQPYQPHTELFGEITYHDYYDPRRCIRTATHKLIINLSAAPAFMDPSQSWRPRSITTVPANPATAYHPKVELYDLVADPWEQNNLADKPEVVTVQADLLKRLREFLVTTKDPILEGAVTSPMHKKVLGILGV